MADLPARQHPLRKAIKPVPEELHIALVHQVDERVPQARARLEVDGQVQEIVFPFEALAVEHREDHRTRVVVGQVPEHHGRALLRWHLGLARHPRALAGSRGRGPGGGARGCYCRHFLSSAAAALAPRGMGQILGLAAGGRKPVRGWPCCARGGPGSARHLGGNEEAHGDPHGVWCCWWCWCCFWHLGLHGSLLLHSTGTSTNRRPHVLTPEHLVLQGQPCVLGHQALDPLLRGRGSRSPSSLAGRGLRGRGSRRPMSLAGRGLRGRSGRRPKLLLGRGGLRGRNSRRLGFLLRRGRRVHCGGNGARAGLAGALFRDVAVARQRGHPLVVRLGVRVVQTLHNKLRRNLVFLFLPRFGLLIVGMV
mmetsp:Transcript_85727/g.255544  ORF Transcript_85727/g.255544 Transcript_85727/m.255544 type:complete len:364 (+) Transcript_85727:308-1399(+)